MTSHRPLLVVSALAGLAVAMPVFAQGGGGFGGGGNGGGFGGGGFRRMPMAAGTISSVDSSAGTITITAPTGETRTIKVASDAKIVTQADVSLSDLKVGDQVSIRGVPTGITAAQITAGQAPAGFPGGGGGMRFMGGGGPGGPGGPGGGPGSSDGFAMATGKIAELPTATSPKMTITLSSDAELVVKVASTAKISRFKTLHLSDVKSGQKVFATGSTTNGTFVASTVGINMSMGPFGNRGFGQRNRNGGNGMGGNAMGGGGGFGGPPPDGGPGGPPPDDGGGPGGPPPDGGMGGPPPPDNGGN